MTIIVCDPVVSNRKNPTEKHRKKRNILNKVFFEGDVILNRENANSSDVKNAYLANPSRLWTGGVIFYMIDKNSILDKKVHENIYQAIKDISGCSCLVFKEFDANNATGDYIKFRMHGDSKNSGDNCWSYMGRVGGGQVINIPSPNCTSIEIIKHLILHATGALHEHNRPDRDKFVKILYDNIKPGMAGNFAKRKWEYLDELNGVESFGTPYDAQSILHYPANAHGINGNITIQPLHKLNTTIGSTGDMTITDIIELNLVYGCDIASGLLVEYIHQTVARGSLSQGVRAAIETQAEINFNNTEEIKRKMKENTDNIEKNEEKNEAFKNSATFSISNIVKKFENLEAISNEVLEGKISELEEKITSSENSNKWQKNILKEKYDFIVEGLIMKLGKLEAKMTKLDETVKNKNNVIAALTEEIKDKRTNYTEKDVENLLKLTTKRNCYELATSGISDSGFHFVDPDGPGNKNPPIRVWCSFGETVEAAKTEILHDSEGQTEVAQCADPKCYKKSINYMASQDQIQALKEISDVCTQQLRYDCFLVPLTKWGMVQFGIWRDKKGLEHSLCAKCNCDTSIPTNLSDILNVTTMDLLPISSVSFGGVTMSLQKAQHTVGRFICSSTGSPGGWSDWSSWSSCPSCGPSTTLRRRSRTCTNPVPSKLGMDCQGSDQGEEECGIKHCPVNCMLSEWSEFSACSMSCGGGEMKRTREIKQPAKHGGTQCQQEKSEIQSCNSHSCPIDCSWTLWEDVGECSTNICGSNGNIQTTRRIAQQAQHGGEQCHGGKTETRNCIKKCGVALIVGGQSAPKKVELWGPDKKCNYELPDTTLDRRYTTTNYFDGKVLTCGGHDTGNSWTNCYYLDFSTKTWKFHSTLRNKRRFHSSVSMGTVLYLISGHDGDSIKNTEYLEAGSTTWKDGPALHSVHYGSCTVKISQSAFVVIGGYNSKRKVRQYNVTSKSWSYLPDLLSDRFMFGCVMVDVRAPGKEPVSGILVAGGRSPTQQTAEFMSMETMKWQKTTNLINNHEDGIMADLGGRYFIFGGQYTKKVEEFDPWNLGWKTGAGYQDLKHLRDQFAGITTVSCGQF